MRQLARVLLGILVVGCASEQVTPSLTAVPMMEATPPVHTATLSDTERAATRSAYTTATPTPAPTATPTVDVSTLPNALADSWIIFRANKPNEFETLWAVHPDGTELTQLTFEPTAGFAVNQIRDANGEVLIAYVEPKETFSGEPHLLKLLHFPSMEVQSITELVSPDTIITEERASSDEQLAYNYMHYRVQEGMVWSPDGQWLAFLGAINGMTTDVYSYERSTGQVRWLTSGDGHADQLIWSPDSKWIVHVAMPEQAIGMSGGWYEKARGTWAVTPDGAPPLLLSRLPAKFIGWIDSDTVVAYRGEGMGHDYGLHTINVPSGEVTILEPQCFDGIAYALEVNSYLVGISEYGDARNCETMAQWEPGVYLFSPDGSYQAIETDYGVYLVRWSSRDQMFVLGDGAAGLLLNGLVVENLTNPLLPPPSARIFADGQLWVMLSADQRGDHIDAALSPAFAFVPISGDLSVSFAEEAIQWIP